MSTTTPPPPPTTAATLTERWWLFAAALVATVFTVADIWSLANPEPATGPWYKHFFGTIALLGAPIVTFAGLIARTRNRRVGSIMIAVGVAPGVAALVLFWSPPFLLFGSLSLTVMVSAITDAQTTAAPMWTPQ
jgi:hypothetical protein